MSYWIHQTFSIFTVFLVLYSKLLPLKCSPSSLMKACRNFVKDAGKFFYQQQKIILFFTYESITLLRHLLESHFHIMWISESSFLSWIAVVRCSGMREATIHFRAMAKIIVNTCYGFCQCAVRKRRNNTSAKQTRSPFKIMFYIQVDVLSIRKKLDLKKNPSSEFCRLSTISSKNHLMFFSPFLI